MKKASFFSIILVIFGLFAAGWVSYFALKENKRNQQIENEIGSMEKEAQKIRENNNEMKEKISYFETPEFQEKIAKEKLNLQKEGEKVAVIKPSPSIRNSEGGNGENEDARNKTFKEKENYEKWWEYFFKY